MLSVITVRAVTTAIVEIIATNVAPGLMCPPPPPRPPEQSRLDLFLFRCSRGFYDFNREEFR